MATASRLNSNYPPQTTIIAGSLDLNNQGSIVNVGAAGNDWTANELRCQNSNAGGNVAVLAENTENTNASSDGVLRARSGGASGGDAIVNFTIAGQQEVTLGLDNSATDNFTISDSSRLGTNDRLRLVTTTGVLSVDGDGGGSDDPVSLFDDYDDALELRGFQLASINPLQKMEMRERLVEMGVAEWAVQDKGPPHLMIRIQPMLRLLAGGIWQNRQLIEQRLTALEAT